MSAIDPQQTVAELVTERPARARIFEELGIDFCCGGRQTVASACADRGLEVAVVSDLLGKLDETSDAMTVDWTKRPLDELCDHIVETHHGYLRKELPWLSSLLARVVKAHGQRYPSLLELQKLFGELSGELGLHMAKEEEELFPAVRELEENGAGDGLPEGTVELLEEEHASTAVALERMRSLTGGYRPPDDACNTFRALLDGLAALERDLHLHIHEENNILFQRTRDRLAYRSGPVA